MSNRIRLSFIPLLLVPICGCPFLGLVDVPTQLAAVLDNAARYAQDEAHVLAAVDAGTVVDDLGDLSGSWSAYRSESGADPERALVIAQVLSFDADAGTLERFVYQDIGGLIVDVTIQRGDYSVADGGRLTFNVTEIEASGLNGAIHDVTHKYTTFPQYDVQLTRSGDSLKVRFVPLPEDDPCTPAGFADDVELIHRQ